MRTIKEIEDIFVEGRIDDAYDALQEFLSSADENAAAWYMLGSIYRRKQQWGEAINAYNKAKILDPEGPADAAIESIYEIIRFVNTDLMNP